MVIVHLHTVLQIQTAQGRVGRLEVPWAPGMDLAGLLKAINIVVDEENTLLVVNGKISELHQPLEDGDEVHLIPAISGGSH